MESDAHFDQLVDLILKYFERSSGVPARAGEPTSQPASDPILLEYTGVVAVSGQRSGCIYYTCTAALAGELATMFLGGANGGAPPGAQVALDLVGEIANVIGGNAQQILGGGFIISAPKVLQGQPRHIRLPVYSDDARVFPVEWQNHRSYAVFGLRS